MTLAREMVLVARPSWTREKVDRDLEAAASGAAFEVFRRWVGECGGDVRQVDDPTRLPSAHTVTSVTVARSGWVDAIDARSVGLAAASLGGGRGAKGSGIDRGVGVTLTRTVGDVEVGDELCRIHANALTNDQLDQHRTTLRASFSLTDEKRVQRPVVIDIV